MIETMKTYAKCVRFKSIDSIACELGLSNGMSGIFRKLVYDETSEYKMGPEGSLFTTDALHVGKPYYALIEIPMCKLCKLELLESSIVPVPVIEKDYVVDLKKLFANQQLMLKLLNARKLKATINPKRRALPIVPAYAITAHKSQGQTLPKIVIDLNMPSGIVEVASVDIPLSCVQRLDNLVILRDFDIKALQVKPSKAQINEISRLYNIFKRAKQKYAQYFD